MNTDNNKLFLDMFIQETNQLMDEMTSVVLRCEQEGFDKGDINEIFRAMHTVKGSSAIMGFNEISGFTHSIENLLDEIRKNEGENRIDLGKFTDLLLKTTDFIKGETQKIESGQNPDGDASHLVKECKDLLSSTGMEYCESNKQPSMKSGDFIGNLKTNGEKVYHYNLRIQFLPDTEMANLRAFVTIQMIKDHCYGGNYRPSNLEDEASAASVLQEGLYISFSSHETYESINEMAQKILYMDRYELETVKEDPSQNGNGNKVENVLNGDNARPSDAIKVIHKTVSVDVRKLDALFDLVGELVISGVMVTNNKDLAGLKLDNFEKASRQHSKIIDELQDTVMSIRMLPIDILFAKMNRVVRDLSKSTGKDILLKVTGENTEVDKNIIEQLSDPLMHLLRNAVDHGIEETEQRKLANKPPQGTIWLDARNSGGDVYITVKDDGKGLDKEKILKKAKELNLTTKAEGEYTDKEIYRFVLLPGFSTKDNISEISGRGVGMDVVRANIEKLGGTVFINSTYGKGTEITIKIPLTLAIIGGMLISVGDNRYIIPTDIIKESFRPKPENIIYDTDGKEMVMIRGKCHSLIRLHERFKIDTKVHDLLQGILIAVEYDSTTVCLFADELLGEHQVVVKPLPEYIKKVKGIAGCTIQGDGSISLILDVKGLLSD